MQTVTFETAQKLKEAGFPQPDFATGQYWYGARGLFCIITHSGNIDTGFAVPNGLREIFTLDMSQGNDGAFFAPSATDILQQLPEKALMFRGGDDFHVGIQNGKYKADEWGWQHLARNTNPAEAAAAAWLALNEK